MDLERRREQPGERQRRWREANPEHVREYARRHYEANRERVLEQQRESSRRYREANPEAARRYFEANPELVREQRRENKRRYKAAHPERVKEQRRRNYQASKERDRERSREYARRWREAGGVGRERRLRQAFKADLWHEQGGCCYLCGDPLRLEDAHLDHDHRCCPPRSYCDHCARGVSCSACNALIGHAGDDPDRLELIARNLRAKLAEVDERLAGKPEQLSLGDAG